MWHFSVLLAHNAHAVYHYQLWPDCAIDTHADILALFLTVLRPCLGVHMYCARVLTNVHRLYTVHCTV